MTAFLQKIKATWETYLAIALIVGAVVAFAEIPSRVERLEAKVTSLETVNRYIACVFVAERRGQDSAACDSHLSPDLIDYLRP